MERLFKLFYQIHEGHEQLKKKVVRYVCIGIVVSRNDRAKA
jgi:hypothetical protein